MPPAHGVLLRISIWCVLLDLFFFLKKKKFFSCFCSILVEKNPVALLLNYMDAFALVQHGAFMILSFKDTPILLYDPSVSGQLKRPFVL